MKLAYRLDANGSIEYIQACKYCDNPARLGFNDHCMECYTAHEEAGECPE